MKALLTCLFLLIAFTAANGAENLLETDANGRIQARLQNETLEEVSGFFRQKFNIKFIGEDELFQTRVTVSFDSLSLEKALKKIFAKTNVAFKYDSQGNITEARLLPTSKIKYNPALANTLNTVNQQTPAIDQQEPKDLPPELNEAQSAEDIQVDSTDDASADSELAEPDSASPDDAADPEDAPGEPSGGN